MTSKHTPGPWTMDSERNGGYPVRGANDLLVAWCSVATSSSGLNVTLAQAEANARLIAQAPDLLRQRDELLEALRGAVGLLRCVSEFDLTGKDLDDITAWEAIVQKAEGREASDGE